jgi:hypothetical protein
MVRNILVEDFVIFQVVNIWLLGSSNMMSDSVFPCKDCILLSMCSMNCLDKNYIIKCKKLCDYICSSCPEGICRVITHKNSCYKIPCVKYGRKYFGGILCFGSTGEYVVVEVERRD